MMDADEEIAERISARSRITIAARTTVNLVINKRSERTTFAFALIANRDHGLIAYAPRSLNWYGGLTAGQTTRLSPSNARSNNWRKRSRGDVRSAERSTRSINFRSVSASKTRS